MLDYLKQEVIMINGAKYKQWMESNVGEYTDVNCDVNMTELAEGCADHFGVMTELGDSEEETIMFEIATDFFNG
jgi:hypothetical protein